MTRNHKQKPVIQSKATLRLDRTGGGGNGFTSSLAIGGIGSGFESSRTACGDRGEEGCVSGFGGTSGPA